jgi:uncharacterized protein
VKVLRLEVGDALKNPGQSYPFEGELTIDRMDVLGDPVSFRDVRVKGRFIGTGDSVAVEAKVASVAVSRCALCLKEMSVPIDAAFQASYKREIASGDPDPYPLSGHTIELDEAVREALLLELPIRFLCKPDCKGLCPVCGENLNDGRCTCREREEESNPFAALKDLRIHDEEV